MFSIAHRIGQVLRLFIAAVLLVGVAIAQTPAGGKAANVARPATPKAAKSIAPPAPLTWKAATATAKITPTRSMWMAGYAARKKPSDGTAAELFTKALAIEDQAGGKLVIVTNDLIGIRRELRNAIAARLQEAHGLAPERLILNASHTHCGPEYRSSRDEAVEYLKHIEDTIVRIVGEALSNLRPARMSFAHARAGFAMNRRRNYALPEGDANAKTAPTFDGPVDHEVPVLRIEDADGKVKAIVFGYACHNTTVSSTSLDPRQPVYEFNGDYAGFAQEALQKRYPDATAMFMMGCGADQNPYPRHNQLEGVKPLDLAKFHGQTLAYAVDAAMLTGPRPFTGRIAAAWADVELTRNSGKPTKLLPVQAVKFGEFLTLVTIGSEVTVDYALRLKRELRRDPWQGAVWVAGYSNDYEGYIPSHRVAKEGGYEAAADYTLDVEQRIIAKVHDVLKSVK